MNTYGYLTIDMGEKMSRRKYDMSSKEVKLLLKLQGIEVRPSYKHDDYMFTSFTMPYPLKDKLDRICEKLDISRSFLIQRLIDNLDEQNLFTELFEKK